MVLPMRKKQGKQSLSRRKTWRAALFLLPIAVFSLVFSYFPFCRILLHTVTEVNAKGVITGWAGLENFAYVFGRADFAKALTNTLLLTAMNVPLTLLITIGLALLANKKRRLSPVYETLFTMPMAVSMSAACMIFKAMLNPTVGFVNYFFGWNLGWFESRSTALFAILLITLWMGIGFDFLLFLAAFRNVPQDVLDAAKLDGAGFFCRLWRIQLPIISPTILYVLCTNTVLAMMCSGPMIIITQGGPSGATTSLIQMMYASGLGSSDYSLAAILSLTTFVLTLGFTILAFAFERKKVFYQ